MAEPQTGELVSRAASGDAEAYGELVGRFRDAVYGLCYHRCEDFDTARDLAQEAFIRAYQHLGQLAEPTRFPGWLRRIAERIYIEWRRRQREERSLAEADGVLAAPAEELAALRVTVRRALSELPEAQRLAVTLFHINGYSYREISEFLAVPETTIKARLEAGREKLRGSLASAFQEALQAQRPSPSFRQEVMMRVTKVQMKQAVNQRVGGPAPVLLLSDEERSVPIYIGEFEAAMIRGALDKWEAPRPMTYDLVLSILSAFGIRLTGVRIPELRDDIYFAELALTRGKSTKTMDCRASDAVNLALRAEVPVEVGEAVLEKMGISAEQAWLDYGNLPDYRIEQPNLPPLHKAAVEGEPAEVERLLAGGEEPDKPNRHGATPLHLAAMQGHAEVAGLLIAKGADPNGKDAEGRTHLHWASHNSRREVAEVLLAGGADLGARNAGGATPLHVCTRPAMTEFLLSKGADVKATDAEGRSPLHYAASAGLVGVAEALLAAGADANAEDRAGAAPLAVARGAEMKELLRRHRVS